MKYLSSGVTNIVMTVFMFLVIYRPAITSFIHITDILLVWSLLGYIFLAKGKIKKSDFISSDYKLVSIVLLLCAVSYAGLVTFIAGGNINYGNIYIKMMLYAMLYAVYPIKLCRNHNWNYIKIIDWSLQASVVQFIFVVWTLIDNNFKTALLNYLIKNGATGITADRVQIFQQRTFGLADGYFSGLGIVSGIMASICLVMGMNKNSKYYWFIPGLLLTSLVNARTGVVVFLICGLYVFWGNNKMSVDKKAKFMLIALLILALCLGGLYALQKVVPGTVMWILNIGEHIEMATSQGESAYTYYKLNPFNWKWPNLVETIMGTGKSVFGSEGLENFGYSNDSGYLGIIYRGGLVLSALLYVSTYLWCTDDFGHKSKSGKDKTELKCSIIFLLALLVQHYKGGVFYFNEYTTFIIIVTMAMSQLPVNDIMDR